MRIGGGKARGKKLESHKGPKTRIISERVKEALFDILGKRIEEALFLDLYAGTGSVGIEALSRGAREALFVEKNQVNVKTISKNLEKSNFGLKSRIYKNDVFKIIEKLGERKEKFDFIFIGAPYYEDLTKKTLTSLGINDIIKDNGKIIAEHYWREDLPGEIEGLVLDKERRYGDTVLSFYKK
jgi:16S rRNA (guanine(966)-N(2))-methyltransferase RsmD